MSERGKSRYSILGVLSSGPKSGYDIKKMTESSTAHFWAESYGNLYPTLRRLESEGLVASQLLPQEGRPDKRVYRLTGPGRNAFREWLAEPVEEAPVRNELLLKLFFGAQAPIAVSRYHLERIRARQLELLETYRGVERWLASEHAGHPELPFWLMTLAYGRHHSQALLDWSSESLAGLANVAEQKGED
ncbi:MAG: PadR family transcriptional regulator [Trueperaceae bacterium]